MGWVGGLSRGLGMWGRLAEELGQRWRRRRVGSGDQGAGAEGGKGPGRRGGRDQARWRWRGLRRWGRGGRARDTPLPVPWRGGFGSARTVGSSKPEGDWRGAPPPCTGTRPLGGSLRRHPPARRPAGAGGTPGPAGSAGGGTMRRPCGALLLGALLCAHGKRRRRARAHPPAGKVCPRAPAAAGLNLPRAERRGLGPGSPSPSHSKQFTRRSRAGEGDRELSTPPPHSRPRLLQPEMGQRQPRSSSGSGLGQAGWRGVEGRGGGGRRETRGACPLLPSLLFEELGASRFGLTHGLCVLGANECVRRKGGGEGRSLKHKL